MSKIEELQATLEANRVKRSKGREAQLEIDLEARIRLEEEHGTIVAVNVSAFVAGQPTCAYLKTPTGPQYKRYKDQIYRAVDKKNSTSVKDAQELLARSCWVYPETDEAKEKMLEAFPGLLTPLSAAASTLAEGIREEEGKD